MSAPLTRPAAACARTVALLLLASCRSKAVPPPPVDAASPPKSAVRDGSSGDARGNDLRPATDALADEAAARAKAARTARAMERLLCASVPCCVTRLFDFGRDLKGQEQFVVELNGDGECLAARPRTPQTYRGSGDKEGAEQANAENTDNRDRKDCLVAEYRLVTRKNGKLRDVALLARSCNIAADFPEPGDEVAVDEKEKLVIHRSGGGAGLWGSTDVSVGLDPLRRVRIETSSFHRGDPDDETGHAWSWDTFEGTSHWGALDCKAKRDLLADRARHDAGRRKQEDERDSRVQIHAVLVPEVTLPADFAANGWRNISLGACAASLNFTIHGAPGSPDDASARAVVAQNTLFVEVSDDRFVGPGKKWVNDDHLELWIGDFDPLNEQCNGDISSGRMVQWGIRVADGAVFPAHGALKLLVGVERVIRKLTARFKIPLSGTREYGRRLTIVYSDSDDGRGQQRLIASSELRFGNPSTLGMTFPVDEADATCIVEKGALRIKRVPLQPTESPITETGW